MLRLMLVLIKVFAVGFQVGVMVGFVRVGVVDG